MEHFIKEDCVQMCMLMRTWIIYALKPSDYFNEDTDSLFLSVQEVGLTVGSRLSADVSLSLLLMSSHDLIKIQRTHTFSPMCVRICKQTISIQLFSCKSKINSHK